MEGRLMVRNKGRPGIIIDKVINTMLSFHPHSRPHLVGKDLIVVEIIIVIVIVIIIQSLKLSFDMLYRSCYWRKLILSLSNYHLPSAWVFFPLLCL